MEFPVALTSTLLLGLWNLVLHFSFSKNDEDELFSDIAEATIPSDDTLLEDGQYGDMTEETMDSEYSDEYYDESEEAESSDTNVEADNEENSWEETQSLEDNQ